MFGKNETSETSAPGEAVETSAYSETGESSYICNN